VVLSNYLDCELYMSIRVSTLAELDRVESDYHCWLLVGGWSLRH